MEKNGIYVNFCESMIKKKRSKSLSRNGAQHGTIWIWKSSILLEEEPFIDSSAALSADSVMATLQSLITSLQASDAPLQNLLQSQGCLLCPLQPLRSLCISQLSCSGMFCLHTHVYRKHSRCSGLNCCSSSSK